MPTMISRPGADAAIAACGLARFAKPQAANQPWWALLVLLGVTFPACAEGPPKIDKVRVGLPSGTPDGGRMRQGTWTPIYLHLKADPTGNSQKQFQIVLEALDLEENPYRYTVPVPALAGGVNEVVIGYLRAPNQEFTVALQTLEGRTLQGPSKQQRSAEADSLKPVTPLFVVLGGSNLPKLKAVLSEVAGKEKKEQDFNEAEVEATLAKGYARISRVADMPDRWFGYDAVDVLVLVTDNDEFMKDLTDSLAASRRKALGEWVRRGGKLILSVGRNHQLVNSLLSSMPLPEVDKMPLLPFEITGSVQRKSLPTNFNTWIKAAGVMPALGSGSKSGVEIAKLSRGPEQPDNSGLGIGTNVLFAEPAADKDSERRPIVVQASCGLGQVLLVAFDLDGPPFNTWEGQLPFWRHLRNLSAPHLFDLNRNLDQFGGRENPELYEELQRYIDNFEDVPVISFGWVALFILLYILVVGPLDYFILKKVFKRLELTWITFPIVVITISIGAYFVAYALKGDDLRINKVDLIDLDFETPQVYGTSWFTIFSPRIQNYTLSVEPRLGGRAVSGLSSPKASTMIALLENPTATPRGGSASIFRQPYEYAPDAAGVEHVPIPVWSTRSFVASWRTPFPPDQPPLRADLTRSRGDIVTGKIVNEMPVDLQDVCLFYRDRWYKLPNNRMLASKGDLFDVTELGMGGDRAKGLDMGSWYRDPILGVDRTLPSSAHQKKWAQPIPPFGLPSWNEKKKEIMFMGNTFIAQQGTLPVLNSGLRQLNQNWRLGEVAPNQKGHEYREEVILVARTAFVTGSARQLNQEGLVKIWNDQLPSTAERCPELPGFLSQEAYIRVYIPVKNP